MNEKINLKILGFEDKLSKGGRQYTRFKTDKGWMSAFDDEVIKPLKESIGKNVSVEIASDENKGFTNIRKFIGSAEIESVKTEYVAETENNEERKVFTKDPIGLVIELVASGRSINDAIEIVRKATKAFA